jgi:hypothetical protein
VLQHTVIPPLPSQPYCSPLWGQRFGTIEEGNPDDHDCIGWLLFRRWEASNRARATWDHMRVHRHRPLKFTNEYLQINPSSRNFHAGALVVLRPVGMYAGFRRRPPKAPKPLPSVPHVQMDSPCRPVGGTNRIGTTKPPPPPPVPVEPFERHVEHFLREHAANMQLDTFMAAVGQRERAQPSVPMPHPLVAPPPLPPPPPLMKDQ